MARETSRGVDPSDNGVRKFAPGFVVARAVRRRPQIRLADRRGTTTLRVMRVRVQSLVATMTSVILAGGCSSDRAESSAPSGENTTTTSEVTGAQPLGGTSSTQATPVTPVVPSTGNGATSTVTTGTSTTAPSTSSAATSATTSGPDGDPSSSDGASNASDNGAESATDRDPESTGKDPTSTGSDESSAGGAPSAGCGKSPTLKNSPGGSNFQQNDITVGGANRQFIVRLPTDYDNTHPYRVILGLHGANGSGSDIAGNYFGLWDLAEGSTIFVALSAEGGLWDAQRDLVYVDEVLTRLKDDLCIDTSSVLLEGFSQGAAMAWTLTCSRPGVFGAVVGHSGGGVAAPQDCEPVPYLGSLGLDEGSNSQKTQTDRFAQWNGCTVETLPTAPSGGHVCTPYPDCPTDKPVVWCSYDGGHTPSPTDAGQGRSWMPERVWEFLSQY